MCSSDFLGSTALCGFAPFPGTSQEKQRPRPLSALQETEGLTPSRASRKGLLLLHFDYIWMRKHGKNSQRSILMSYLCNTHVPSSLLAQSCLCQQQKHSIPKSLLPVGCSLLVLPQIQPPITIPRLNSKGIPSTWCG